MTGLLNEAKTEMLKHLIKGDYLETGAVGKDFFFLTIKNKHHKDVACFFFDIENMHNNDVNDNFDEQLTEFIENYRKNYKLHMA